jgi:hypothetical protein
MTIDDKTYRDLVNLGRKRCREAALSVLQLVDDEEQQAAFLVNCALELAAGAVCYIEEQKSVSQEEALKRVLAGLLYGLDVEKYVKAHRAKVSPKGNNPPTT